MSGTRRKSKRVALAEQQTLPRDDNLQLPRQDEYELDVGRQRIRLIAAAAARLDLAEQRLHPHFPGGVS
ncbi:MAG TPA: hypothetical protein VFQ44_14385 [Streptosporangiaceae bacterium]|nr:hypothetical protein [Streptosporangiaceae bacterium]